MSYASRAGLEVSGIYQLRTCPYNPAHQVGVTKFPMHLARCQQRNPMLAAKMEICFYNRTHHVLKTEMAHHLMECPEYMEFQAQANASGLTCPPAPPL